MILFTNFSCRFLNLKYVFKFNFNCSYVLDLRVRKVICLEFLDHKSNFFLTAGQKFFGNNGILLQKLFWPTVRKNCSNDLQKFLRSLSNSESSEEFLITYFLINTYFVWQIHNKVTMTMSNYFYFCWITSYLFSFVLTKRIEVHPKKKVELDWNAVCRPICAVLFYSHGNTTRPKHNFRPNAP